jgi:hypothetical protein
MHDHGMLDVFDATARVVISRPFASDGRANITLDTRNFAPGMYTVRLSDTRISRSARLMKISER